MLVVGCKAFCERRNLLCKTFFSFKLFSSFLVELYLIFCRKMCMCVCVCVWKSVSTYYTRETSILKKNDEVVSLVEIVWFVPFQQEKVKTSTTTTTRRRVSVFVVFDDTRYVCIASLFSIFASLVCKYPSTTTNASHHRHFRNGICMQAFSQPTREKGRRWKLKM